MSFKDQALEGLGYIECWNEAEPHVRDLLNLLVHQVLEQNFVINMLADKKTIKLLRKRHAEIDEAAKKVNARPTKENSQ